MASLGFTKTIDVGAISASEVRQFAESSDPLSTIRNQYGHANIISVTNMSLTINLMIRLDGDASREIFVPGGSIITWDEQHFRFFDMVNLTTNTSAGGEVYILVGWTAPSAKTSLTGLR